jgi:hypothetical protein
LFFILTRSGSFSFCLAKSSFLAGQVPVSSFQADLVFRCLRELKSIQLRPDFVSLWLELVVRLTSVSKARLPVSFVSRVGFCRGWLTRSRFCLQHCAEIFHLPFIFSAVSALCSGLEHALSQVLVSSRVCGLFFGLPVLIFAGLCSILVLSKGSDWIFLPRLSSLLSCWFLFSPGRTESRLERLVVRKLQPSPKTHLALSSLIRWPCELSTRC